MSLEITPEQKDQLVQKVNAIFDIGQQMYPLIQECLSILKCRELQIVAMDFESIAENLNKLAIHGPTAPFAEIPLENSETEEEFELTNDQIDEKMWTPNEDGICPGDLMLINGEAE